MQIATTYATFYGNNSIATTHHNTVQVIHAAFPAEIRGNPQFVKLPFKYELGIVDREVLLFNEDKVSLLPVVTKNSTSVS